LTGKSTKNWKGKYVSHLPVYTIMNCEHKVYVDLDGVLLGKAQPDDREIVLARHARELLEYCIQHYQCYWLTTHCKDGDTTPVVNILERYADEPVMKLIRAIKPTSWKTMKTEAIDFQLDFYLIDDQLLQYEIELLKEKAVLNRWIQVDTRRNPDDLKRAISIVEGRSRHLQKSKK